MKRLSAFLAIMAGSLTVSSQLQAPALVYPINGASVVDVNVRMTWNPALGGTVTGYEAMVSKDTLFTTPITPSIWGTSGKVDELDFNTVYFWRVRAKGSGSTFSAWSGTYSFTTFNNQFTGMGPTGSKINPETEIAWDTIAGVVDYVYLFDEDSLFGSPVSAVVVQPSAPDGKAAVTDLAFGTPYYWKVKARHSKGESAYSNRSTFTVLSALEGLIPLDSTINIHPIQKLQCKKVPGVREYRFMIDDSTDFDINSEYFSLLSVFHTDFPGAANVSVSTQRLGFGKTFYWKVIGVNQSGASDWSVVNSMSSLSSVNLISPTDGASNVNANDAKFFWQKIIGAEQYEMQYDTDPSFVTATTIITLGDTLNHVTLTFPQWDVPYHWRVRAMHSKDVSDWSTTFSFNAYPAGVSDHSQTEFSLYPNPASSQVFISGLGKSGEKVQVELYNILGERLETKTFQVSSEPLRYDLSAFDEGVYLMAVAVNGEREIRKLIIK